VENAHPSNRNRPQKMVCRKTNESVSHGMASSIITLSIDIWLVCHWLKKVYGLII